MSHSAAKFLNQIDLLVGSSCWAVIAGQGNGSTLTFHLGNRIPRKRRLPGIQNPNDILSHRGEYCIYVKGCAWRLHDTNDIICGWGETEHAIQKQTEKIIGCTLTTITCLNSAFDLRIEFDNRYSIQLFCDQTVAGEHLDNYAIRIQNSWYIVETRSQLIIEG